MRAQTDEYVKEIHDELCAVMNKVEEHLNIRKGIGAEIAGALGDLLWDIESWMGWDE